MAAWIVIEEERGTYVGTPRHPHNGYYAGDFFASSRAGSQLADADTERDVPRVLPWCHDSASTSEDRSADIVATSSAVAFPVLWAA